MARTEIENLVTPSLLDRLTDLQPKVGLDPTTTREESERAFKRSVERDVESLLNTRRTMIPATEECPELRDSVHEYGLVDTTGIPVGTKVGRERLLNSLRDSLERYEPRMADIRVRLVDADQVRAPQMHFVIEAVLLLGSDRQQVVFDTMLEVARGEYEVRDSGESPSLS